VLLPAKGMGNHARNLNAEEITRIKSLIRQTGTLEFRILANTVDDVEVINATTAMYNKPAGDAKLKADLESIARNGGLPLLPPEPPMRWSTTRNGLGNQSYKWVELGRGER